MNTTEANAVAARLRDMAFRIMTCEQIRWGHDSALMLEAADCITALMQPQWISVEERLPPITLFCDWLYPASELKGERWILANECMATASVPGMATHWRPAVAMPSVARTDSQMA